MPITEATFTLSHNILPHLFWGRGYPQLTWLDNYKKMGSLLGLDLANNPELALVPESSAAIMIEGMLLGFFHRPVVV